MCVYMHLLRLHLSLIRPFMQVERTVLKRSPSRAVYEAQMAGQLTTLQGKRQQLEQRVEAQREEQRRQQQRKKEAQAPPPFVNDGEVEVMENESRSLEDVLREKAEAAEKKGEMIDLADSDDEGTPAAQGAAAVAAAPDTATSGFDL